MSLPPSEIPLGAMRFNSDSQKLEFYDGAQWLQVSTFSPNLNGGARGVFGGGSTPTYINTIDYITISTTGNAFDFGDLTIDHVTPVSHGGKTEWTNCVTSCKACNWAKADKLKNPIRKPYRPDYWALAAAWRHSPFKVKDPKWNQYLGRDRAAA